MKLAIIGSRDLMIDELEKYVPKGTTEIISGGANGIDRCAKKYAYDIGLKYTEFLPDYKKYKRAAPLKRNIQIIEYADEIIAFWNGKSKGTKFVIDTCNRQNKKITVYVASQKRDYLKA